MSKSLHQWFSYIEGLHVKSIALGLKRITQVAENVGWASGPTNPNTKDQMESGCVGLLGLRPNLQVITVAGTNGKGSCVAFLEAIYSAAGYKVGTYTSPHLLRFNERIRMGGREITDQELISVFQQVEAARGDTALTYFEFTTLAALCFFQAQKPDVLVLEVGLGGRLDAVNVVEPDVAVITTIALDHMDWLGNTREAIGFEKAGIFRQGKPAVCGDLEPPNSVVAVAQKLAAPLYCVGKDFNFKVGELDWSWWCGETCYEQLPLPMLPVENAATALMGVYCLRDRLEVSEKNIIQALKAANLAGRFQIFPNQKNPSPLVGEGES